ncbi:MAG: hypothetical protein L6V91_05150 [Bacilli bacterium]|nr:MAG: hypothetical protein L6V91_05150 [Bacilli bacterium]
MLYHSGASFKDLGKKCFAITKIVDNNILEELLDKLKNVMMKTKVGFIIPRKTIG